MLPGSEHCQEKKSCEGFHYFFFGENVSKFFWTSLFFVEISFFTEHVTKK